jgi:hypothetical protein
MIRVSWEVPVRTVVPRSPAITASQQSITTIFRREPGGQLGGLQAVGRPDRMSVS